MDKRGNAFLVIALFFILFVFFIALKNFKITGYAVDASDNLSVDKTYLTKVTDLGGGNFSIEDNATTFSRYDNLGCLINYHPGNASDNLTVGFYSKDKSVSSPDKVYYDIFNDDLENTICQDGTCLVYYNQTELILGDWKCFTIIGNITTTSNILTMENTVPKLIKNIEDINLEVNGSYNGSLNLNDYFFDPEDVLSYGAVNQLHLKIFVDTKGNVTFSNPSNFEGYEFVLFRAFDGTNGTFSNNVTIKIGNPTQQIQTLCTPIWDCKWDTCINGQQACVYTDKNNCNSDFGKPANLLRQCSTTQLNNKLRAQVISGDLNSVKLEIPSTSGTQRNLLYAGLVLLSLIVIGFGSYLLFNLRKKKEVKTNQAVTNSPMQKTNENKPKEMVFSNDIQKYIFNALKSNQKQEEISRDLIKNGWQKKDVDDAMNYVKLKIFVNEKLNAGFDKEKIVSTLKAKGWKEDLINSLF